MFSNIQIRVTIWAGFVCFLACNFTGCAVLRRFPHNYNCPPAGENACNECSNSECSHCGPGAAQPELASVIDDPSFPMAGEVRWDELSKVQEQLVGLNDKDLSLQEQLATLDKNLEQHRLQREENMAEIRAIASQVSSMGKEMRSHKLELEQVETSLLEQRANYEQVLASVEKQLIDVLQESP